MAVADLKLPYGSTVGNTGAVNIESANAGSPATNQQPYDARRDQDGEVGRTGTEYYSGFLNAEEYNPDLQGLNAIKVYDKMGADGTVKAMLRSIILPIRGAVPKLDPASEDDRDVHIAKAVEYGLTNMIGQLWDNFVRQFYGGAAKYGHAVFERVYVKGDGAPNIVECDGEDCLMPFKLAPRLQKSIYQWDIDTFGELKGINQRTWMAARRPEVAFKEGPSAQLISTSGTWQYIYIRSERLTVFVLDQDGANYLGESILRSAYKHWYFKDTLLRIQALGAERHYVGVPYAITKAGIRKDEENAIVATLRTLHAHEKAYAMFSEAQLADGGKLGMKPVGFLEMPSLGANAKAVLDAVNYHDRQMVLSILADFLALGSAIGGNANIMHRDKSSLFFNSLRAIVQMGEDIIQTLIEEIVDLNWPGVTAYPKFRMTSLETKDFERLGRSLALMASAGLLTPDPTLEQELRDTMDLPPLPVDVDGEPIYPDDARIPGHITGTSTTVPPGPQLSDTQKQILSEFVAEYAEEIDEYLRARSAKPLRRLADGPGYYRELRASEKHVDFPAMEEDINAGAAQLTMAGRGAARAIAAKHAAGAKPTQSQMGDLAESLVPVLGELFAKGSRQVQHEHAKAKGLRLNAAPPRLPPANAGKPSGILELAKAMADRIAGRISDFYDRITTGEPQDLDLDDEMQDAADSAMRTVARYSVTTPMNQGRMAAAKEMGVVTVERSALLDKETCAPCEAADGDQWPVDDAPDIPDDTCEGGDNCRCVPVMIFDTEVASE